MRKIIPYRRMLPDEPSEDKRWSSPRTLTKSTRKELIIATKLSGIFFGFITHCFSNLFAAFHSRSVGNSLIKTAVT